MQGTVFFVGDEPYCVWDAELQSLNKQFLDGLDPTYFEYAVDAHLKSEDDKRASIALKLTLHHGLETFFSLAAALLQAPDCVFAWVPRCSTVTLREIVERITNEDQTLKVKLHIASIGWVGLANSVFARFQPGTERQAETAASFAKLWAGLAHEFLEPAYADEYNSLKHGFRVRGGGFTLEFGKPLEDGSPPAEMQLLGRSDFGSAFLLIEPLGTRKGDRSLRVRRRYVNWSMERTILLCKAVHWSILNVTSALRIANGANAEECQFVRPVENVEFTRPWQHSPGVTTMTWESSVPAVDSLCRTKEELVAIWDRQATA